MAGLSVLLETQNTQVISKTSRFLKSAFPSSSSSFSFSSSSSRGSGAFLERCFLCSRKLQQGEDIYMYRGDRGFCSEECRRRQICMDEEGGKRDSCSLAASAAAAAAEGKCAGERRRGGRGRTALPGRSGSGGGGGGGGVAY